MKIKVAFGTVMYKVGYKFHEDFIKSINNQDCEDFDLLIINDDLSKEEISRVERISKRNTVIMDGYKNSSPAELRVQLMCKAKDLGYDLLILGDFDDTFSYNRVSSTMNMYNEEYTFYYNEIFYLNNGEKFFRYIPHETVNIQDIMDYNYLGLSNTSINLNNISYSLIESLSNIKVDAFDWCMYSLVLINKQIGIMVDKAKTFYRIYDGNIAGDNNNSIANIYKEIRIKINHYQELMNYYDCAKSYYEFYTFLNDKDINLIEDYFVNNNNNYWWGNIKYNCDWRE